MHTFRRLLAIAAGTAAICGAATSGASAYAISGGAFTATNSGVHEFAIGPYVWRCSTVTSTGTATGSPSVSLSSVSFSGCIAFGFPATVTQTNPWSMTITGGPTAGVFTSSFGIPSGTSTLFNVPALVGCSVVMSGVQSFASSSTATSSGGNSTLSINVSNVAFAAVGCPFGSGNYATYKGTFVLPGVTIT